MGEIIASNLNLGHGKLPLTIAFIILMDRIENGD